MDDNLLEIKYNAKFVKFTGQPNEEEYNFLNREEGLSEIRALCQEHQICADLYSLSDGSFVGSVLETGIVYSNLSRLETHD